MGGLADIPVIATTVQALRLLAHTGVNVGILLSALGCCTFAALHMLAVSEPVLPWGTIWLQSISHTTRAFSCDFFCHISTAQLGSN